MKWRLKNFELDDDANIIRAQVVLRIDKEIIMSKWFVPFVHEGDKIIIDTVAYTRDTPLWEEQMRRWIAFENKNAQTFDSLDDYVAYVNTIIALE